MAVKLDLNLTEEQKAVLADLLRNYYFVYQNGKLQMWLKVDEPIIVEGPLVQPGVDATLTW